MMKTKFILRIFYLFLLVPALAQAQLTTVSISARDLKPINKQIDDQQKDFKHYLAGFDIDGNIKSAVEKFVIRDVDALQLEVEEMKNNTAEDKVKALNSIAYFINALKADLNVKKFSVYKLPSTLEAYTQLLPKVMNGQPVSGEIYELNWRSLQLLSNSFFQYPAGKHIEDIATYKRIKSSPQFIISFLENNPGFPYKDSLLISYATQYPTELLNYYKTHNNELKNYIRTNPNAGLQQIITLANNINASEILPFTEQLVTGELSVDSVLATRRNVTAYFQLLVNTIVENNQKMLTPHYQKALYQALRDKSLNFYVKEINTLHSSPDAVRFASVKNLRPQDLYYIITSTDQDMYTSTYLGLYKRLTDMLKNQPADTVFSMVEYDHFRKFLRIAAQYNTLLDFFKRMPTPVAQQVLHYFVAEINMDMLDDDELITEVMDVADAFLALSQDSLLAPAVKKELTVRLDKYKAEHRYHGVRVFEILNQAYNAILQKDNVNSLRNIYNYESIAIDDLRNKKDTVNEVVLFYGDEDGLASYKSFMNIYKDTSQWKWESNSSFTTIRGQKGQPVTIYASLPLDMEEKKDLLAQDTLFAFLADNNIQPSILIHRGHSYHLANTLKRLTPQTKLAVLGSCGGYNNIKQIVSANPDIQIIASKQTGSMIVNDPMLNAINMQIVDGKDVHWEQFWNNLSTTFKSDSNATKLFNEYVPPYKNVGVFVYRLYNLDQN